MKCVEQIKTPAANRNADGEDSSVLAFSSCDVTETSSRKKQGLFGLTASEVWVTVGYPAVSHQDITVHHGGVQDGGNRFSVVLEDKETGRGQTPQHPSRAHSTDLKPFTKLPVAPQTGHQALKTHFSGWHSSPELQLQALA